jgi:hypothetical protein
MRKLSKLHKSPVPARGREDSPSADKGTAKKAVTRGCFFRVISAISTVVRLLGLPPTPDILLHCAN